MFYVFIVIAVLGTVLVFFLQKRAEKMTKEGHTLLMKKE